MNAILLHPIIFYSLLGFEVILMGVIIFLIFLFWKKFFTDVIIFIDKSNRWKIINTRLGSSKDYDYQKRKYFLMDKSCVLNRRGKALYIFSIDKPQPMKLSYNMTEWLTSESMMSIMNNKLIQKLIETTNPIKDVLMLFGAIGGLIAGIASVIILVKTLGVI